MLHTADKKPQRTVPVSWLLLHPPPATAASQNPQIRTKLSHWWGLQQTELEWRRRKLLLSAQLESAMQKLHLLLNFWMFFHLVNMQWSPRILCLPPRCLLPPYPSLNRSLSSKAATQEATAGMIFSGPTWFPANASRKGPQKALLPILQSPGSSPMHAPVLKHQSQFWSKGLSVSKWGSYIWASPDSHIIPYYCSYRETQIHLLTTQQSLSYDNASPTIKFSIPLSAQILTARGAAYLLPGT